MKPPARLAFFWLSLSLWVGQSSLAPNLVETNISRKLHQELLPESYTSTGIYWVHGPWWSLYAAGKKRLYESVCPLIETRSDVVLAASCHKHPSQSPSWTSAPTSSAPASATPSTRPAAAPTAPEGYIWGTKTMMFQVFYHKVDSSIIFRKHRIQSI